jgi:hypothetical protein
MAHWAATKDDEWQTGAENNLSNPVPDIPSSINAVLPAPLLDGGQGKRTKVKLTKKEWADGGGMGAEKRSDWNGETGNDSNATMEILDDEQPNLFAGALHPTNSRVRIRPSDTPPPQLNGTHLCSSEMTPPPNGDATSVSGLPTTPFGMGSNMVGNGRENWQERIVITGDTPSACEGLQPHVLESMGVVGRLDMYRTKVLMYHTMVLMACLTKVRR